MTPFDPNYHVRLYNRAIELADQNQLQLLAWDLKAMGKMPKEIDVEIFFALIHEGYRQRWLEEKLFNDANYDYEI
jgi:hypothetical protein